MEPQELVEQIVESLEEKQGLDIVILDVETIVGYTSFFVMVSGRSERQVQALVEHVRQGVSQHLGIQPLGIEGKDRGRWALIDFGDAVVHIFREDERNFYDLEGLWSDAPRVEYQPTSQLDSSSS